jgi:putative ABC transport system substrate-binding protein
MRRREFVRLVGGAAAAWPLAARAQQPAMPVVGFLSSETPSSLWVGYVRAFREGLRESGYAEGRNVAIEYRWAEGHYDRLPALAADLVEHKIAVIATNGPAALAAQAATTQTPIVFLVGADPVEMGLVASINRPGGTITGVTSLNLEVGPKRLELMHELVPKATNVALLVNQTNPILADALPKDLETAADSIGVQLRVLRASTEHEVDTAFADLLQMQPRALVIANDPFFIDRIELLAALTVRHAVPAIFVYREFVAAGGLISYGSSLTEQFHQVGVYTGRILKGEKPGDLPVQRPTKFELVINLKTAKALRLTVPPSLLAIADEVIE